jgi:5-formyltetrahydrofolate cyclo-ligase
MVVPPTFSIGFAHMGDRNKPQLRAYYRKVRSDFVDALSDQERKLAFRVAAAPLARIFQAGKRVAGYIPIGAEADPRAILQQAANAGCITALPFVTSRTSPIQFLQWSAGDALENGPFGLQQPAITAEPCIPDVVLVPLVAFDSQLMRLGQGAGHYDRALSLLTDAFAVGIAWSVQQAPMLPSDPWDVPLNAILTEKAWIAP